MQVMYVSAEPGNPSTLWQSDSGKFYRTKKEALADSGEELKPDELEIKTSWLKRNAKTIIISLCVSLIVAAITAYMIKYKLK